MVEAVVTQIDHIQGRAVSVPARRPWSIERTNAGTESRCSRRHQAAPIRRDQEEERTATAA